jgi:carbonyl reductase 1
LTARDPSRGQKALEDLRNDPQLQQAQALQSDGGLTNIVFHPLDISDDKSIHAFGIFLAKEHEGGIDFGNIT